MFKRGEMIAICKPALAKGPMNTRQLSAILLNTKGLDATDKVLAKAISYRLIHALRLRARGGKIVALGRDKAARIWECRNSLFSRVSGVFEVPVPKHQANGQVLVNSGSYIDPSSARSLGGQLMRRALKRQKRSGLPASHAPTQF